MFHERDADRSIDDVLRDSAACLAPALRGPAENLIDEVLSPDGHSGFVLGYIADLRNRVMALYDDIDYVDNPTEEIWAFGSLLHLRLVDDQRPAFDLARRRTAELLLACLASWEDKDQWELDVEMMLQEQLAEDALVLRA